MTIYITDPTINTQIDNLTGNNPIYIGKAFSQPGVSSSVLQNLPVWTIEFLTYDSNGNIISVVNGVNSVGSSNQLIWANRANGGYIYE